MNNNDMKTRPRWQSLLIAFGVVFGLMMVLLWFVNRWVDMPLWMLLIFGAISAFLIVNKFFARTIL